MLGSYDSINNITMTQNINNSISINQEELPHYLHGFEDACKKMQMGFQNPSLIKDAEATIGQLKRNPKIIELCRFILENSTSAYAKQHISLILRGKVYQDYSPKTAPMFSSIRDQLLNIVLNEGMVGGAAHGYLQVAASIVRRSWIDNDSDKMQFLQKINSGLQPEFCNTNIRLVSLMFLSSLLKEFEPALDDLEFTSLTSIRETFENHFLFDLAKAIIPCLKSDYEVYQNIKVSNNDTNIIKKSIVYELELLSNIFGWENSSLSDDNDNTYTKNKKHSIFNANWQTIVNTDLINILYGIYESSIDNDDIEIFCGQALNHLFDLDKCFADNSQKEIWLNQNFKSFCIFLEVFVASCAREGRGVSFDTILCSMANIMRKISEIPASVDQLRILNGFTLICIEGIKEGDDSCNDAILNILEYWGRICDKSNSNPLLNPSSLGGIGNSIVNAYLDSRIFAPEDDDGGISERELHRDELINISKLARVDPSCLTNVIGRSEMYLTNISNELDSLYWSIIVLAYIIADSDIGEVPSIPTINSSAQNIKSATKVLFESFEKGSASSSLIAETSCWALRRWAGTYLFCEDPTFIEFRNDEIISHVISVMQSILEMYYGDETVINELIGLYYGISMNYRLRSQLKVFTPWKQFSMSLLESVSRLPSSTHREVIKCLSGILPPETLLQSLNGRLESVIVDPSRVFNDNSKAINIPPEKLEIMLSCINGYIGLMNSGALDIDTIFNALKPYLLLWAVLGARDGDTLLSFTLDLFDTIAIEGKDLLMKSVGKETMQMFYSCIARLTLGVKSQISSSNSSIAFEESSSDCLVTLLNIINNLVYFVNVDMWDRLGDISSYCDVPSIVSILDIIIPFVSGKLLSYKNVSNELIKAVNSLILLAPNKLTLNEQYAHIIDPQSKNQTVTYGSYNEFFKTKLHAVWKFGLESEDSEICLLSIKTIFSLNSWLITHNLPQIDLSDIMCLLFDRIFFHKISPEMSDISGSSILSSAMYDSSTLNKSKESLVNKFFKGTDTITSDIDKANRINQLFDSFGSSLSSFLSQLDANQVNALLNVRKDDLSRVMNDEKNLWFSYKTHWARFLGNIRDVVKGI